MRSIAIALAVAASLVLAPAADAKKPPKITYVVTGSVPTVSLTFTKGGTQATQYTNHIAPWTLSFKQHHGWVVLYQLMAQNTSDVDGSVTCKIKVGNRVVRQNTSTGIGAIADCQYNPQR